MGPLATPPDRLPITNADKKAAPQKRNTRRKQRPLHRPQHPGAIGVYDMLGQKVAQLVSQSQNAGTHQVRLEAGHLASGYYFYRIQAGAHTLKRQILLLK